MSQKKQKIDTKKSAEISDSSLGDVAGGLSLPNFQTNDNEKKGRISLPPPYPTKEGREAYNKKILELKNQGYDVY
ncbi:MAG: hypothetical protein RUMPE_00250 [Eubacteriales bacterium SKADARSKE-1]|nr:hypothetical protein [Eubacteriales bacterium SKADARSKE-1]